MVLEHLFGSTTRWKLLWLFFSHPEKTWFVRELVRATNSHMHGIRRELSKLEKLGIIHVVEGLEVPEGPFEVQVESVARKKFYALNTEFFLLEELKDLFMKDRLLGKQEFVKNLDGVGDIKYLLLSGTFTGDMESDIDMLIVGALSKERIERVTEQYKKIFDQEIRYALMSESEFQYRRDVVDKFLYDIFERNHLIVRDTISK